MPDSAIRGSIWISAGSLSGAGFIHANGGAGASIAGLSGGGGGGGRIAICVMDASNGPVPSAQADGGNGYQAGQPGTVYWPINCPIIGENFSIDPRGTYLHTNQDPASLPRIIDLQSLGITPGDMIELERLGDFNYVTSGDPSLELTAMIAVFSSSDELRARTQLRRVAGAIDAGMDISTINTFQGSQPTDIDEDFLVDGIVTISVPTGGRYLFVGAHDEFYSDNSDTDNSGAGDYAIRVAKLPDADFNNDGFVDMADYGVWRANFGAISGAGLASDGNFDGQVNAADYVLWRKNLGASVALSADAGGSGNGVKVQDDDSVWRAHVGEMVLVSSSGAAAGSSVPISNDARATETTTARSGVQPENPAEPAARSTATLRKTSDQSNETATASVELAKLHIVRDHALATWSCKLESNATSNQSHLRSKIKFPLPGNISSNANSKNLFGRELFLNLSSREELHHDSQPLSDLEAIDDNESLLSERIDQVFADLSVLTNI